MKRYAMVLPLVMTAYVSSAYGYGWLEDSGCGILNFNSGHMTFNLTNSLSSAEDSAIENGTDRVTLHSDSFITLIDNNDSSYGTNNGQNEVFMDPSHGTAYCSAYYNTSTCDVVEADIGFGNEPWETTDGYNSFNFGEDGRSMTGTAVHEGGHCVGMAHENRYYNMMGADFEHLTWDGGDAHYGPGEDMSHGLINLHGKRSATDTYRDLGVTVMRYSYASGAYSRHEYGVLRDTSGSKLPVVGSFSGQELYHVNAGQQVRMELTLENNGEQNLETPSLGFYLSTNDVISTADTQVGSGSPSLGRALPWETYYTVTIPSSTAGGDHFLGAYIDDDGAITEYSGGWNNTAYYPIRVCANDEFEENGWGGTDDTCFGTSLGTPPAGPQTHLHCDEDWVWFNATVGHTYVIETSNLVGGSDTTLAVHQSCGPQLAYDDDGGVGLASRLEWTATGTFADVRIRQFADHYAFGEGYDITITRICPTDLVLDSQTLSGTQAHEATSTATLGPNLVVDGTNIVVNAPTLVFMNGVEVGGTFQGGNATSCP